MWAPPYAGPLQPPYEDYGEGSTQVYTREDLKVYREERSSRPQVTHEGMSERSPNYELPFPPQSIGGLSTRQTFECRTGQCVACEGQNRMSTYLYL